MEIPVAYKEAETALRYVFLLGEGTVIEYRQIQGREYTYIPGDELKISTRVMEYIKKEEDISPIQFVAELLNVSGVSEDASMEAVDFFKYEIVGILNRILVSERFDLENNTKMVKKLMCQPTMKEFEKELVDLLVVLKQAESDKQLKENVCDSVKRYIDQNYKDPDLSLEIIEVLMKR